MAVNPSSSSSLPVDPSPEPYRTPSIEIVPAGREQEPVLANLLELYAHDFSEYTELHLQPDGRFGYPPLPSLWTDPNRDPFLVRVDGYLAGFVFVTRGSQLTGDPGVYDMTEFFIARGYRKRGVGTAVATRIWHRFPGPWEVRVMENNHVAVNFWRSASAGFVPSGVVERSVVLDGRPWRVLSFDSRAAAPA